MLKLTIVNSLKSLDNQIPIPDLYQMMEIRDQMKRIGLDEETNG